MKKQNIKTLYYFSNELIPSPMACTIQQMHMCQAFQQTGLKTTLVRPWFFSDAVKKPDSFGYYDIQVEFEIVRLPSLMSLSKPASGKKMRIPAIGGFSLMWSIRRFLDTLRRDNKLDHAVIYSRNLNAALVALNTVNKTPVWFEAHAMHEPLPRFRRVLEQVTGVVTISSLLRNDLAEMVSEKKVMVVEPDGVDEKRLYQKIPQDLAKRQLGLKERFCAVYTGKAYAGKGVDIILDAARQMPQVQFVLVGTGSLIHSDNVICLDYVPPAQVQLYQCAADVVLLPNTESGPIHRYTSPLKLFEYMAANRPIIASDIPVFKDVLVHQENALLFKAGNSRALVAAIETLYHNRHVGKDLCRKSREQIDSYTFQNRARRIRHLMETHV
ncbi:glycosyltransferase [candidate division KSB1 bacterium]|nr:glycosyltransferase [candidate division KSB1 bacterium]